MNVTSADLIDQSLDEAHMLMVRGEYDRARGILVDLKARNPRHPEVDKLLTEVIRRGPSRQPGSPAGSLLQRALAAQPNNMVGRAGVAGLLLTTGGIVKGLPALNIGLAQGLSAPMPASVRPGRAQGLTVRHELSVAAQMLVHGLVLLAFVSIRVARILRSR